MNIYSLTDNLIMIRIGESLKTTRLRQNITQAKLAFDSQVSLTTVKNIENGKIASFGSLISVMRTLGKLDILIPLVEEQRMSPNEYYEFVYSQKRKERKRASSDKSNNPLMAAEPEW